jgi:hypothetical protein
MTDPGQGLASSDVQERTAAIRALGERGDFADFDRLMALAKTDRSPSVRLTAAGVAADLAVRAPRGPSERARIVESLRAVDPGTNPPLVLALAAVRDRDGLDRLGRLLRDPRSDVRMAAATAVRRMANLDQGEVDLPGAVRRWLTEGRHPPDALAELVRLAGECGWPRMEDAIRAAAAKGRAPAEASVSALEWLAARQDPTSWAGMWMSTDDDQPLVWLFVEDAVVWGAEGRLGALQVADGIGTVPGRGPLRRVWATRTSVEGTMEAITCDGRTLWRHKGPQLTRAVDELFPILKDLPDVARGLAAWMKDLEGLGAMRARATALWQCGQLDEAEKVIANLLHGEKKPNPQVLWLKGHVAAGLGDRAGARAALERALETGPKKAGWRGDAEALLQSLAGG